MSTENDADLKAAGHSCLSIISGAECPREGRRSQDEHSQDTLHTRELVILLNLHINQRILITHPLSVFVSLSSFCQMPDSITKRVSRRRSYYLWAFSGVEDSNWRRELDFRTQPNFLHLHANSILYTIKLKFQLYKLNEEIITYKTQQCWTYCLYQITYVL